jgi:tetratricopeptide (TPR) repeat protein
VVGHWLLHADYLNRLNRPIEAEALAERGLAVNPRCANALSVLLAAAQVRRDSDLYYKREAALDACTPYRKALEHCLAGNHLTERDHLDAAARAFKSSVDSTHPGVRRFARLGLINVLAKQRRWRKLAPLLPEFEAETPVPSEVVLARAAVAASTQNWDEAVRMIETLERNDDDDRDQAGAWLMHYLYHARQFSRLAEVAKAEIGAPDASAYSAFQGLWGLYRIREYEDLDERLRECEKRFSDSQTILWLRARRLRETGNPSAARAIWRTLPVHVRRWNPDARQLGPVGEWARTLGRQFSQRLWRW